MIFAFLTMLTALSISAVAIYYSVAGLMTIFAAAALPIMIMGGVLEVGKLVTAVWLHRYWKQATWWLKTYLTTAVLILMFITSMGIFGFLSKAHIEQTSASQESVAQVERLTTEIARQNGIVERADERIRQLESTGTGSDANVQAQIDKEQERIDNAYSRVQPAIDEQQRIIDSQAQLYKDELTRVDVALATLQGYIDAGGEENIKRAQQMVGARADGAFGPRTAEAFRNWQAQQQELRTELLAQIQNSSNNSTAQAARREIQRLRETAESQIADSNNLIARLRTQVGSTDRNDIDVQVDEQRAKINEANNQIDTLTEQKYALEAEYRKLEAEVGPVKYIAEFVYGEQADTNLLEEAVRWVILVIIFVFDPLAVLLLIASQYTFELHRKRKDDQKEEHRLNWEEYERARAQAIVDNPGYHIDTPAPLAEEKEEVDEESNRPDDEQSNRAEEIGTGGDTGTNDTRDRANNDLGETEGLHGDDGATDDGGNTSDGVDEEELASDRYELERILNDPDNTTKTDADVGSILSKNDIAQSYISDVRMEQSEVESNETSAETKRRTEEYEQKEKDINFSNAKATWKAEHPEETLKHYKNLYIQGKIEKLPWESTGYTQNEEQNENSLFNKINK